VRAVYADTGYWVALVDESDALHPRAVAIDESHRDWPFVSSDFVLSETVTLLRRRAETQKATDFGRRLMDGRIGTLLRTEPQDWAVGLALIEQFPQHRLSFADATSIALVRRLDIPKMAAFDQHFSIVAPEREILGR
jgi:predicted nucleic acid-binding protein